MERKRFFIFIASLFLFLTVNESKAQLPAFWNEIRAFKKLDKVQPPPKNAILFVGSSSFAFWKDVQNYFPGRRIINRGFGGSSLADIIRYVDDVIVRYHPKQVVIYCGENDLASSDTVSSQVVLERFTTLFRVIREKLGDVRVTFVSLKPSPVRAHLLEKMKKVNIGVKNFLRTESNTSYIDVFHKMLDERGQPMPHIFTQDQLHMNASGYKIWQKAFLPYLEK